jgi:Insulin-like growth factor binding protein
MNQFWSILVVVLAVSIVNVQSLQCSTCKKEECPPEPTKCLAGMVEDSCGCCLVCGNLEGDRCDRETGNDDEVQYGPCGDNLQCRASSDLPDSQSVRLSINQLNQITTSAQRNFVRKYACH